MKVLFIFPNSKAHTCTPPLGLGYMASVLIKNGHKVKILDCKQLNLFDISKICEKVRKMSPDLIGISIMTSNYCQTIELVKGIKSRFNIPVVIGGTHVSAMPKESLIEVNADFAVIGEGEITLLELVQALEKGIKNLSRIDGLAYFKKNKVVITKPRELIKDLDSLGFPAWELMPPNTYLPTPQLFFIKRYPVGLIMSSRGCPYNCSFCGSAVTWRRRWRARTPSHVVDEIEMLVKEFGVKEIHFEDDNLTLEKKRIISICDEIIRRKLDIVWKCPNGVRVDTLDEEVLRKMKDSGCYQLAFGIESASEKVRKLAHKTLKIEKIAEVIRLAHKIGIESHGFFIIGLPGEDEESVMETINFAKNVPLISATFPLLTPLPGTEIFKMYKEFKNKKDINWEELNYHTAHPLGGISSKALKNFQKRAIREFYSSPKVMFNLIRRIKIRQLPLLIRVFFDYMVKSK